MPHPRGGDHGGISSLDYRTRIEARGEVGQTAAEYAVVLGMITAAVVAVFAALSNTIPSAVNAVINSI